MLGFEYKKNYEASVKEVSGIELILAYVNDDLEDYMRGKASEDETREDLLRLINWALKNEAISCTREIRLVRLLTNISRLVDENAKLKSTNN